MRARTMIIGSGQAGIQVAMSLRQGGYDGEIVVAGKERHVPYQRPPLSKQVLKKEWAAERCQLRHLDFYEKHDIDLLLGVAATRLDPVAGHVTLDDGSTLEYSSLAICTGSRLNRLDIRGSDLPGVCYLRTIDDAMQLASALQPGVRLVVIGGGYMGLEVASAARSLGCEVCVVEAMDQVMKRSAVPAIAEFLQHRHLSEGVAFRMTTKVAAFIGVQQIEGVQLENGEVLPADLVMVGVGVRPDLRWLEGSGIETNRGVLVDTACCSNLENIYAAGDVAELQHPLLEGRHVLESVQNAVSQGKIVAASILGQRESYGEAPWFWSEQYDCRLQMAGIPRAGDYHVKRNNSETGGFSIFTLAGEQVNAVQSINSPRDYMLGRQFITHRVRVSGHVLSDSSYKLKELL